ncbi:MAG: hypothetical protein E6K78_01625 [Candidatus Eisenbacteria bacterium]|uniref:exo-alpha-sialidase n=1 Tax=Eiseniibacteriota bacterium TaxID=2212470 RepID=A0A538TXJ4_UNCEI|nr:MAG: hypothetical protein E6K78_01625 [Candidatus Eisenbacteria bacterium]
MSRGAMLFLLLLSFGAPARGYAGDPHAIPTSRPLIPRAERQPVETFVPEILRASPGASPLVAGPAGTYGTVALPRTQSEAAVAASGPLVVVATNDFRPPLGIDIVYSTDGGATFTDAGKLPIPVGAADGGDPSVAVWKPPVGPAVFFCTSLGVNAAGEDVIFLHRSTDGGATWAGPFEVTSATSAGAFPDRASMAVDPETGRMFVAWTNYTNVDVTIRVTRSDDAATGSPPTWAAASIVGARTQDGQATSIACDPKSNAVYLAWQVYPGYPKRDIAFIKSMNNGNSWSAPRDIGPQFNTHMCAYGFDRWLWSFSGNCLAVNPLDGGIEMVYAASVDGTPAHDFGDIYYRRSANGGAGWSAAVPLNVLAGADRPQVNPCVSVTQSGRIDVFWYDLSAGSGLDDLTDVFYTYSTNLGATWSSPVPLDPEPFHNEAGNSFNGPHQGDYNDAYSDPLAAGPSYAAFAVMDAPSPATTGPDPFAFVAQGTQVAPLRVRPGTVSLVDHGCPDGSLVAGEGADLTIPLENIGRGSLTGITATLQAISPGVLVDVQPRSYPTLASGASAVSSEVYRVALLGGYPCGTRARFRLDITATGVASTYVEFTIPTGVVTSTATLLSENFDGVVAPALPPGWSALTLEGTTAPWTTTAISPASAPNAAFVTDPATLNFERLQAPLVTVPAGASQVEITFDTRYELEQYDARFGFDGLSFDYLLDGVGFERFSSGDAIEFDNRYTHNLSRDSGNSGDRSAWSGTSLAYKTVRIVIPGLGGHTMTPYFDLTSDLGNSVAAAGAWVDNVNIEAITLGCGGCAPVAVPIAGFEDPGLRFEVAGANPFASGTRLRYHLPRPTRVRIEMFTVTGQRVATLLDLWQEPGEHGLALDVGRRARALGPGVYFARITAAGESRTLRLVALE